MDLQRHLIESQKTPKKRGGWKASATSLALHGLLIGSVIFAGAQAKHSVAAEKAMPAFITQGAAPPPPPPPPPPKKASGGQKATPKVQQPKPVVVQQRNPLTPPVEIPKELPKVDPLPTTKNLPIADEPVADSGADDGASETGDAANGVVGGVEGGVAGGVVGGEVGGVLGGEIGGVKGGVVGGEVGGTGTGTEGSGTGGNEAPVAPPPPPPPPPVPSGPMRVGGAVKAPIVANRAQPEYTEAARKARIAGTVIVEAIIDKNGNVDQVRLVKGLPMGLSEQAMNAVRKWKFKPGTMNGQNVDTIFNLTVTFQLE